MSVECPLTKEQLRQMGRDKQPCLECGAKPGYMMLSVPQQDVWDVREVVMIDCRKADEQLEFLFHWIWPDKQIQSGTITSV